MSSLAAINLSRLLGRRPATDDEIAGYERSQQPAGAPADFAGMVLPNPRGIKVSDDTESGVEPTRLPNGVSFQHGNFTGPTHFDVSNPPKAELSTTAAHSAPMSTVPIFDPDGHLGDIPAEQLAAAVKAGAKPGVNIFDPDGHPGVVPADRYVEAAKAGAKIAPFEEQDIKHPGFWASLGADLKAMIPSGDAAGTDQHLQAGRVGAAEIQRVHDNAQQAAADAWRQKAGYSALYRAAAPVGEGLGVDVPGMELSAQQGDVAGVAGHAATVPAVMAATEGLGRVAPPVLSAAAEKAAQITPKQAAVVAGGTAGAAAGHGPWSVPAAIGTAERAGALTERLLGKERANAPIFQRPAAAAPAELPEGFQSRAPYQAPAGTVDNPAAAAATAKPVTAVTPGEAPPVPGETPKPGTGAGIPRTLSGESSLRQILTGQDNANLLKIARSRGINISAEAQLKPGVADGRIINKIIDDFSDDELDGIRSQYLETKLHGKHDFGDIGPEAWKTMSLQTYFPDVKIPQAALRRTQGAIAGAKAAEVQPQAAVAAAGSGGAPVADDLTAQMQKSIDLAKSKGGVFTSADPQMLTKRWGVNAESIADTDANLRGKSPADSQAYIDQLADAYKKGQPVDAVVETRDAQNNLIKVDGRHRALAAAKAGVDRIPVIVRRLQATQ